MIDNLPLFHRISGKPVVVLGSGEAAEAKRRLVRRAGAEVMDDLDQGIVAGARLAFVAHDDDALAQTDAQRAQAAGMLVNATDRPELCDFTVPSILDRSPVLLAIGTGGASAGLAKQLRLRLEALLPASLGSLAKALEGARSAMRMRWPDAGQRRRALDDALSAGGPLDPLAEDSADRVAAWLGGDMQPVRTGVVDIVLRSADPEDLTLRELRLLGAADTIAHESGVAMAVLDRARADAVRVPLAGGEAPPPGQGLVVVLRSHKG